MITISGRLVDLASPIDNALTTQKLPLAPKGTRGSRHFIFLPCKVPTSHENALAKNSKRGNFR